MTLTLKEAWYAEGDLEKKLWDLNGNVLTAILRILASAAPEGFEDQLLDALMSLIEEMSEAEKTRPEIAREVFQLVFAQPNELPGAAHESGRERLPAAFTKVALFDHRSQLLEYVRRQLPAALQSSFDPSDVVQDVYFEALRRSEEFVNIDAASSSRWLMTIARNRILYLVRRQKASKRDVQRRDESDSLVGLLEELAQYERTPSASAASHEIHLAIQQSVSRLAPAQAEAIRWRFFEGMSFGEVANRTGRTESSVRQLCHYALGALRKDLAAAIS